MNVFLSTLYLNSKSRQATIESTNFYEMHRTLLRAFPVESDTDLRREVGLLFRVEPFNGSTRVVVQSLVDPCWTRLPRTYLSTSPNCRNVTEDYTKFRLGHVLNFKLRANPVKRVSNRDDPMRGKRVGLRFRDELLDWLFRKGQAGGFSIEPNDLKLNPGYVYFSAAQRGAMKNFSYQSVLFEGRLQVNDEAFFYKTLVAGIGPAKAFGFGLLSVIHNVKPVYATKPLVTDSRERCRS